MRLISLYIAATLLEYCFATLSAGIVGSLIMGVLLKTPMEGVAVTVLMIGSLGAWHFFRNQSFNIRKEFS